MRNYEKFEFESDFSIYFTSIGALIGSIFFLFINQKIMFLAIPSNNNYKNTDKRSIFINKYIKIIKICRFPIIVVLIL